SETIIDINSTSTSLESDSLNTKTSQINIEQEQITTFYSVPPSPIQILDPRSAPVSPIIFSTPFNITTNHNTKQPSSSSYIPLYLQLDTSNNFSPKFSSIPISTQHSIPLSPLVLPTTYHTIDYNIETLYQLNIKQFSLYPQIDKATWSTFYTDNYNTKTQYTPIYPILTNFEETIQTSINNHFDLDSEQSFKEAFTVILNQ
ncbi:25773_t:CDS:2, partial [Gigaspora margarita]